MVDLVEWLLVQIAEDERMALRMDQSPMHGVEAGDEAAFMHFLDSDRIHAECVVKRRLVEKAQIAQRSLERRLLPATDAINGHVIALRGVVRWLALPYADRDGYRQEWAP